LPAESRIILGIATAGKMKSPAPNLSSDVDMQLGATENWGLASTVVARMEV
jgi:hypothetical protein